MSSVDDQLHALTSKYMASPQWVKTLVGGLYGAVPKGLRHGPAYTHFSTLFRAPADKCRLDGLLAATLETALRQIPAFIGYKSHLKHVRECPRSVLEELPIISKEEIKQSFEQYVNPYIPENLRLSMYTGGSTSVPMHFYIERGISRAKEYAAFDFMAERFDTDGSGVVLALRGQTVPKREPPRFWMYEPIKRHLILSSDHLEAQYMPHYVEAIVKWKPRYIHAFPSALFPLVVWLNEHGYDRIFDHLRSVTLFSESVFQHQLIYLKSFFRCPVIAHYGHTERAAFAFTLPEDPRYHVLGQYGHVELIDGFGRSVSTPGQVGEIVATSFDNRVMPFVRYRTGDYAVLGEAPDERMAGSLVWNRIEGRLQEYVVCRDSRLITVTTLGAAHIREFELCLRIQYEQMKPGQLKIRVVPLRPLNEIERTRICTAVESKTQGGCRVEIEEVDDIERTKRGKQRLLIQHIDLRGYLGASMLSA